MALHGHDEIRSPRDGLEEYSFVPSGTPVRLSPLHPIRIFDTARAQGRYVYVSAPMVRYSKLAFRQTVFEYGADLCWSPMILAKEFNRNSFARDSDLSDSTVGPQPPTIVQFGSNDPTEFSRAASLALAAPSVVGIDLNCGCPQSWACAETLGAALMNRRELVRDMLLEARARLSRDGWRSSHDGDAPQHRAIRSLSVKIRVHHDLRKTIDFLRTVINDPRHLVDFVTIHPRTRNTPPSVPIISEALSVLTSTFGDQTPLLLSGDIFAPGSLPPFLPAPGDGGPGPVFSAGSCSSDADAPTFPVGTKLVGVMAARGLLANPALFAGHTACPWEAVEAFMSHVARAPLPLKLTLHHLTDMCSPGMGRNKRALLAKSERAELLALPTFCDVIDFLDVHFAAATGRPLGLAMRTKLQHSYA